MERFAHRPKRAKISMYSEENRKRLAPLKEVRARLHETAFLSPRLARTSEKGMCSETVAVGSESPFQEWKEKSCHFEK